MKIKKELNIKEINDILPHKYPFQMVDKIIEIKENSIIGVKNVTINEAYFKGHFPENPIMPGILQIESLAQTGGILILSKIKNYKNY
jgi:UDP-3-O-[3-hydroxymyristoyl] N-acetylglucosamine deacetylase/3-hydroxyacyl-[acyl-carrier-protein] dehydratase|tara:strand:- start:493 stop:753 length:261 start_codon:yes stop_codon:yes gene_type:complete